MNEITQNFIASIGGKTKTSFLISTAYQSINGEKYATFEVAKDLCDDLKHEGYESKVLNPITGEVLYIA